MTLRIITELGAEQQCRDCGDYWPLDLEFWPPRPQNTTGLATQCRACYNQYLSDYRKGRNR